MTTVPFPLQRVHGGPDAFDTPRFDFSSNGNACGPCPQALTAIRNADAGHYPDASYTALRMRLADFHGVDVRRVVLAASASDFIYRITAMVAGRSKTTAPSVWLPQHSYGDYAYAAAAHGLSAAGNPLDADLCWACEPSSPLGVAHDGWLSADGAVRVIDLAYEPLRLNGTLTLPQSALSSFWQLYSPNKAMGLTGGRAAYAIAPVHAEKDILAMQQLCASWPLGAHGVALLLAWTQPDAQAWLAVSRDTLRDWKVQQLAVCESLAWTILPSDSNFFVCCPHKGADTLTTLRAHGIKLRDCTSFGLPGHVRMSVQPPVAQQALLDAWRKLSSA